MIEEIKKLIRLQNNPIKQYAWGCIDKQCTVARLSCLQKPYKYFAQFWMGVHCHGQSQVKSNQNGQKRKLSQFLKNRKLKPLQFLYKVLSIQKCLSLQLHPNKQQALRWYKQKPDIYGDDNDKPEMLYTLTQFEFFIGYVSKQQFIRLSEFQIFKNYFNKQSPYPKNPKQMIIQILKLDKQSQQKLVKQALPKLEQIHPLRYNKQTKQKNRKIWKILQDFPNDIGIVVTFFLQYKIIPSGVCYYIQSNMPHAYIYGQCLQIMKNSDNVCRLGLTPKLKDLQVMQEALGNHFEQIHPVKPKQQNKQKINGEPNCSVNQQLFNKEGLHFLILNFPAHDNKNQEQVYRLEKTNALRICLLVKGNLQIAEPTWQDRYQICKQGDVLLIEQDKQYRIRNKQGKEGLVCIGWSDF